MRKVIIILVVMVIAAGMFFSPTFIEKTHSILFSLPPDKIIMADQEIREPIEPVEIPIQSFENFHFETLIVQNIDSKIILYGGRSESMGVITSQEIYSRDYTKWYKSVIPVGYFQRIDKVEIYSPQQILFNVGGNVGTTLFWGLLSLGLGLISILIVSVLDVPQKKKKLTAVTA